MSWAFWRDNSAAILAMSSVISAAVACVGVIGIWLLWKQQYESRKDRRARFYESLNANIQTHNWKFIEHWKNPGVRPAIEESKSIEQDEAAFGLRVVVLSHLNLLWKVYLHKDDLDGPDDIDGFKNWALSWFDGSLKQLEVIFQNGDLMPLPYVVWLRDEIFTDGMFERIVGKPLKGRLDQYDLRLKMKKG